MGCIDAENGEYCFKKVFPSRVNYYFFSRELCDLERKGVEKLFSSMKSDIGNRSIRTWTDDAVDGVLLIGFLAQAMVSVTRFLCEPASLTATKFITDAMQKLTLTVVHRKDGERRFVLFNFNPLNEAVLGCCGLFSEVPTVWSVCRGGIRGAVTGSRGAGPGNCQNMLFQEVSAEASVKVRL